MGTFSILLVIGGFALIYWSLSNLKVIPAYNAVPKV